MWRGAASPPREPCGVAQRHLHVAWRGVGVSPGEAPRGTSHGTWGQPRASDGDAHGGGGGVIRRCSIGPAVAPFVPARDAPSPMARRAQICPKVLQWWGVGGPSLHPATSREQRPTQLPRRRNPHLPQELRPPAPCAQPPRCSRARPRQPRCVPHRPTASGHCGQTGLRWAAPRHHGCLPATDTQSTSCIIKLLKTGRGG